jgi:hypothetical protein
MILRGNMYWPGSLHSAFKTKGYLYMLVPPTRP